MVFVNQQKLCSPPLLLKWVKELENTATNLPINNIPDVIEMDEIYTRVKKGEIDFPSGFLILGTEAKLLRIK